MDLKDKIKEFNQRWSVVDEESYQESFNKFKTRILNILKDIDSQVTEESIRLFCQFYGIPEEWKYQPYGDHKWSKNIISRLVNEEKETEFYKLLEVIFSFNIRGLSGYGGVVYNRKSIYDEVCQAIELSNVNLATTVSEEGGIFFYPKGEEKLDDELVNLPLSFLNKGSGEHFMQALKFYQSKKYIKSAESLRRSLEEFLRYKLNNSIGLTPNISALQKRLKSDGRDPQVRNIISQIFSYVDQYFNENSKHNDGDIDESENEFLIYQTGLLMRYINATI